MYARVSRCVCVCASVREMIEFDIWGEGTISKQCSYLLSASGLAVERTRLMDLTLLFVPATA